MVSLIVRFVSAVSSTRTIAVCVTTSFETEDVSETLGMAASRSSTVLTSEVGNSTEKDTSKETGA